MKTTATSDGGRPVAPERDDRLVSHISETARWVAAYRAMESERPDALFHDPLAARLAGDRGRAIADRLPEAMKRNPWPMIMRTTAFDDLLAGALAEGADRVINLAAGFDARPYRLPLPPELTWVEADLPDLLDEKEKLLSGEEPRCRVVRERVDLADPAARAAFLDRATAGARRVVVMTEGLLVYLPDEAVRDLAGALAARAPVRSWIVDLISPPVLRMLRRHVHQRFSADAEMRFAPPGGVSFFAPQGWQPNGVRSLLREAFRARRLPLLLQPLVLLPEPDPRRPGKKAWTAVVRLDRSSDAAAAATAAGPRA